MPLSMMFHNSSWDFAFGAHKISLGGFSFFSIGPSPLPANPRQATYFTLKIGFSLAASPSREVTNPTRFCTEVSQHSRRRIQQ